MKKPPDKVLLRVCLPKWFQIFYAIAALVSLPFFLFISFAYAHDGFIFPKILVSIFMLAMVGIILWAIPQFYSTICVTEFGVRSDRPFGLSQKKFKWDEIVTVSRPRFGIPYDLVYIMSQRGEKLPVVRGVQGYSELLEIIQSHAPNLTSKHLARELRPKPSWKSFVILFLSFIAYVLIRWFFRF